MTDVVARDRGEYRWPTGIVYTGEFHRGHPSGTGRITWPDGSHYEGEVLDGIRHGQGRFVSAHAEYSGTWVRGKRHGRGVLHFLSDGSEYEGAFVNDERTGQGIMRYANGDVYSGEFFRGKRHGQGTFEWLSRRERYTGEWKNGKQHGQGEHVWFTDSVDISHLQRANRHVGEWADGERHGPGIMYYANGAHFKGTWVHNQRQGRGEVMFADGTLQIGEFTDDRLREIATRDVVVDAPTVEIPLRIHLTDLLPDAAEREATLREWLVVVSRFTSQLRTLYRHYSALHRDPQDPEYMLSGHELVRFFQEARLSSRATPIVTLLRLSLPPVDAQAAPAEGAGFDLNRRLLMREFVETLARIAACKFTALPAPARLAHMLKECVLANAMQPAAMDPYLVAFYSEPVQETLDRYRNELQVVFKSFAGSPHTITVQETLQALKHFGCFESDGAVRVADASQWFVYTNAAVTDPDAPWTVAASQTPMIAVEFYLALFRASVTRLPVPLDTALAAESLATWMESVVLPKCGMSV